MFLYIQEGNLFKQLSFPTKSGRDEFLIKNKLTNFLVSDVKLFVEDDDTLLFFSSYFIKDGKLCYDMSKAKNIFFENVLKFKIEETIKKIEKHQLKLIDAGELDKIKDSVSLKEDVLKIKETFFNKQFSSLNEIRHFSPSVLSTIEFFLK